MSEGPGWKAFKGSAYDNAMQNARLKVGDRVKSEWGEGTVIEQSPRRIVVRYDNGEETNTQTGTPGYDRIKKIG